MFKGLLRIIVEGIRYLTLLLKTTHVRKLRKAVDAGETFINLYYDMIIETDQRKKDHMEKRMKNSKRIFYKFNQG